MDNVYKTTELVGSSRESSDDAIRRAIAKASESIRHLRWFEVQQVRGQIEDGAIHYWQVTLKVGFTVED